MRIGPKISARDARVIVRLCHEGDLTQWEIARIFEITQSMVSKIYNGVKWARETKELREELYGAYS